MNEREAEQFLEAMMKLREDQVDLAKKYWQKMMKPVTLPIGLRESLQRLTKDQLDAIRKSLNVQRASQLKKNELIDVLNEVIPKSVPVLFEKLDQPKYDILKMAALSDHGMSDRDLELDLKPLMKRGILFPGSFNGTEIWYMPEEMKTAFNEEESFAIQQKIQRNTEWVQLTKGLLYHYGVLSTSKLFELLEGLEVFDFLSEGFDLLEILDLDSEMLGDFNSDHQYFWDEIVGDVGELIGRVKEREDLDYRLFSKEQLIQASVPMYYEVSPPMQELFSVIKRDYELDNDEQLDDIGFDLINFSHENLGVDGIMLFLKDRLEFPSRKHEIEYEKLVKEIFNNTPNWELKGHTPNELNPSKPNTNVISLTTGRKVGRNDPCPCGSGKKFKKCCG
ncbi:SEC-C metal-binding domain-containing protein [Bacillus sp. Marseille-P3800]|uniref:SEC-C metal-binding domain-containing protein n=1 Tax=Bacillus sp. Marseille-P3800 TaxID=2014782 RepID=UPI000C07510E|nr:SEC-C metal-binding domain-containing protein [Bacillus sp. Marseille-P3800]